MSDSKRRKLLHTRHVECRGYLVEGGFWEVEGRMTDLKSFSMQNEDRGGVIAAGEPLHDIGLTLTVDRDLVIHKVHTVIDAAPFNGCARITDAFQALLGLQLVPGFNRHAKELLGGVKGCTHLLELLGPIATTAHQTLWQSENGYSGDDPQVAKLLVDSCHSLAREGKVMAPLVALLQDD